MAETTTAEEAMTTFTPQRYTSGPLAGLAKGPPTIEYNEYPHFEDNLICDAFVQRLVGHFNNEDPEKSFDESWTMVAQSKPNESIRYMMAKKHQEGFPIIELMGFAEYEGISAKVRCGA